MYTYIIRLLYDYSKQLHFRLSSVQAPIKLLKSSHVTHIIWLLSEYSRQWLQIVTVASFTIGVWLVTVATVQSNCMWIMFNYRHSKK